MARRSANTFVAGDANAAAGYGRLGKPGPAGQHREAERTWPYVTFTELEVAADAVDDEEELSRRALSKKALKQVPSDSIGQLTYRPHSFVNGSTRGLTGIMSGVEPRAVLEQLIDLISPDSDLDIPISELRRPGREAGSIFGQRPIGTGAPQVTTMHPNGASRTKPNQGMGSKRGWFSPHPPKPTDPHGQERAMTLDDLLDDDDEAPVRHAGIERKQALQKAVTEGNVSLLVSYVRLASGDA